jgi:hypothetical protein
MPWRVMVLDVIWSVISPGAGWECAGYGCVGPVLSNLESLSVSRRRTWMSVFPLLGNGNGAWPRLKKKSSCVRFWPDAWAKWGGLSEGLIRSGRARKLDSRVQRLGTRPRRVTDHQAVFDVKKVSNRATHNHNQLLMHAWCFLWSKDPWASLSVWLIAKFEIYHVSNSWP